MDEAEIQKILDSIGAIAELLKYFYDQMIDKGFTKNQALELTIEYLHTFGMHG